MTTYTDFREALDFEQDKYFTNEHAFITHYMQSYKSVLTYEKYALPYINCRLDEPFKQYLINLNWDVPFPPPPDPDFTFIDLFAGIGGFRLALQELNGKCVFSSEIDNSAKRTYESNFGEVPFGDIREFTGPEISDDELNSLIPDHDILAGGFPCQPFSLAGVSARNSLGRAHGFADTNKGNLFFDILRIVDIKKPKVVFLENVKNFKRHDSGNTFSVVKESFESIGYTLHSEIINSKTLVPQKRERFYMVAFRDEIADFKFPLFDGEPKKLMDFLEESPGEEFTISDKLWAGHQRRTKRNLQRGTGFTAFTADINKPANTLVARYGKDGKECLIPQEGKNPRKLTPRECARLQGFPEKYILPASNAAAYRQFGNSVAVPVIKAIVQQILVTTKIGHEISNFS